MLIRSAHPDRSTRAGSVRLALVAALLLALAVLAAPARAGTGTVINLHPNFVGANSAQWKSAGNCDAYPAALVGDMRWILQTTNVNPTVSGGLSLSATFQNDGVKAATSTPTAGGATHTWLVDTSGNDILQSATTVVPGTADAIVLVAICPGTASTPQQSLQDASMTGSRPQSPVWLVGFGFILLISASALAVANARVGRRRG